MQALYSHWQRNQQGMWVGYIQRLRDANDIKLNYAQHKTHDFTKRWKQMRGIVGYLDSYPSGIQYLFVLEPQM
jgi:hypothetical protein